MRRLSSPGPARVSLGKTMSPLLHCPIIMTVTFRLESTGESEPLQKFERLKKVQNLRNVFACLFFMFHSTDCLGLFVSFNTERKTISNQIWMQKLVSALLHALLSETKINCKTSKMPNNKNEINRQPMIVSVLLSVYPGLCGLDLQSHISRYTCCQVSKGVKGDSYLCNFKFLIKVRRKLEH